jgi:hypothetical protein
MLKIKLHSQVDLITNSSTTIYTYSRGSVDAFKNVVNEMLSLFGQNKTCDDVFSIVVACELYEYIKWKRGEEEEIKKTWEDVINSRIEKPEWFSTVENNSDAYGFYPDTYIYIVAKSPEYERIGKLLREFLYSTDHEGSYDG